MREAESFVWSWSASDARVLIAMSMSTHDALKHLKPKIGYAACFPAVNRCYMFANEREPGNNAGLGPVSFKWFLLDLALHNRKQTEIYKLQCIAQYIVLSIFGQV